jgi:hypothetical protein
MRNLIPKPIQKPPQKIKSKKKKEKNDDEAKANEGGAATNNQQPTTSKILNTLLANLMNNSLFRLNRTTLKR